MALLVQKYGGTSVGSVERIKAVAQRLLRIRRGGHQLVVVVSAMSGETDRLLSLAKGIRAHPNGRELDVLLATGEQVTIALLCLALETLGCPARSYLASQVKISTDSSYNKARILSIDSGPIRDDLQAGKVVVVAGFQGVDVDGNITTLGRGGSDTTAVALAAALNAEECQIYTDVDGVYTTDPKIVPEARRLDQITYEEMLEMASLGAKVLQIRSVEFASKYGVAVRVLSSFAEGEGTLIKPEENTMEQVLISGVTANRDEAKVTLVGVPDKPGIASAILGPIAQCNIEVDMIVQNIGSDGTTDFTFTVHRNDYERTLGILKDVASQMNARQIQGDNKIAKISVIGVGMRSHAGIAAQMFGALAAEGINIRMISTSEIKISVVVDEKYLELAVRTLHSAFGLEQGPHISATLGSDR
ncbi:MAG: aspartate kinase [Gammaproteobacteria bacterium]